MTFTEAVTGTGTPQLGLTIGSQTRQAVYDATQSKGTLIVFSYYVQATDVDADGISIAANALTLNGGTISLASALTTAAALAHAGVGTDDTRKVDGSTDVVEHGNSRAEATLVTLTARTTGGVGKTGQEDDFRAGVATDRGVEVAGALEAAGDVDYFRVEVAGAGTLTVATTGRTDTVGALEGAAARQATGAYTLAVRVTPASGGTPVGSVVPPPVESPPADGGAPADGAGSRPAPLRLNAETAGTLQQAGEVDYFRVEVQEAGTVVVEASGAVAPAAYFGTGGGPLLPQGAAGESARAAPAGWPVTAGTYHVAVVGGATRTQTGAYTVAVRFTAASEAGPLRATLLNVAPAQAWVHFYCGRAQDSEAAACTAQVQCGQQDGVPVTWDVTVAPETIVSYWPGRRAADGTSANFEAALVAAGQTDEAAGQRTTCRVFSPDPLEVRAYTQVGGDLVSVANPPAPVDAVAPTRVATLLNVAPAHAWVHFYCRKAHDPAAEPVDPCTVRLQCGQRDGAPVAWDVPVAPETIFSYWPDKRAADGTPADFAAALIGTGKTETEARQRTTCQVFSTDPVDVRAYTQVGGAVVPVANPPVMPAADAPTRIGTLLNVAPAHAWVHFYCRKAHQPEAEPADPCNVQLQCGQQAGASVAWNVEVAPETIFSYWPGRTAPDGTSDNLAAALVAAGKTEAGARRRTTCQVFSADPVDVRGYTQLDETVIPVKN